MSTEKQKLAQRASSRRWRLAHPEEYRASQDRSNAKRRDSGSAPGRREYLRNRYHKNPTYRAKQLARTRRNHSVRRYGITLEQRAELFEQQGSSCAICESPTPQGKWHTDHCHRTKKVRGVLCHLCNVGLGQFKDNAVILRKAARYLIRNSKP